MRMRKRKKQQQSNSPPLIQPQPQPLVTPQKIEPVADLSAVQKQASQAGVSFNDIDIFPPEQTPNSPPIQAKLTIGQPNDQYEQEADAVAHQVVNQIHAPQAKALQRDNLEEDEETVQTKSELQSQFRTNHLMLKPDRGTEMSAESMSGSILNNKVLQRSSNIVTGAVSSNFESSLNSAKGGGQPIPDQVRQPMEGAMGSDFSEVKVHTDAQSNQLNQSIQAKAFTTGTDIFFKQGEYNPATRGGQELLAHELTHVVQQSRGQVQRKNEPVIQRLIYEDKSHQKTISAVVAKKYLLDNGISEQIANEIINRYASLKKNHQDIVGLNNLLYIARNEPIIDNSNNNNVNSNIANNTDTDEKEDNSDSNQQSEQNAAPSLASFDASQYGYNYESDSEDEDNEWKLSVDDDDDDRMWDNIPGSFTTLNTANNLGNSVYTVTNRDLTRIANINKDPTRGAEDQVKNFNIDRHVCYAPEAVGNKFYDYVHKYKDSATISLVSKTNTTATINLILDNENIVVNLNPTIDNYVVDFDWYQHNYSIIWTTFHYGHAVYEIPAPTESKE